MLPGIDGYQVCREIRHNPMFRSSCFPQKAKCLTKYWDWNWADDYIIKPFDSKELVARVKAVLSAISRQDPDCREAKGKMCRAIRILVINLTNYSVIYYGKAVDMPPKELELLYFLASSPNQVFTREQLPRPHLGL